MSARQLSLFAILSACVAYGIGMGLTLPLLSIVLERRGVAGSVNGLNLAIGGLAALVVTPYVPRWIGRFGAAEILGASLAIAAAALLALYAVPNLWLWFPVRFVLSSALNALFVASEFWINRLATEETRGRVIALYATCLGGSFGIGPALLPFIGTHGLAPFAAGAGMLLLAAIPVMVARRNAPAPEPGGSHSVFSVLRLAPLAFAAAFVFGAIDAGMIGLLPVYAIRSGYTEAHAALVVTAIAIGSVLFGYPIGMLSDRIDRRYVLALCALVCAVGAALAPFAVATPVLFYLVVGLWGGIGLGIYNIGLTLLGQRFASANLATANAGYIICYCMGLLTGPAAEGAALDAWNPNGLVVVLAAIPAAYLAFLLFPRAGLTSNSR